MNKENSDLRRAPAAPGKRQAGAPVCTGLAFGKANFVLMAVSMLIVILGFILMSGGESTPEAYDATIFSTLRIKVAPVVAFFGFILMIVAILYSPKGKNTGDK